MEISFSVERYQQFKSGMVYQASIAVRLQYCGNWQFGIHTAEINAYVHEFVLSLLHMFKCSKEIRNNNKKCDRLGL